MGDLNTASDAVHEAATKAIRGAVPVVIGLGSGSPFAVLPDLFLLELLANGVTLQAGELFRRRDGRTVRVLPVADVTALDCG
jgi:hypothetical protein